MACWIVSMQKSLIIVVVIVAVQRSFKRRHAKLLRAGGEMSLRIEVRNCQGDILQEGSDLALFNNLFFCVGTLWLDPRSSNVP
jgi:hypothetical protein